MPDNPLATQPPPQPPPSQPQGGRSESWDEAFNQFKSQVAAKNQGAIGVQKKIFADNPGIKTKKDFVSALVKMKVIPPDIQVTGLDDMIQKAGGQQAPGLLDKAMSAVKEHFMGAPQQQQPAPQAAPAPKPQAQPKTQGDKAFDVEGKQVNVPQHVPSQKAPTKAWKYNNPGNVHFANQAGATLADDGVSAEFDTPEHGYAAIQHQIYLDSQKGMTLGEYISKYAPPSENNTKGYIERVVKGLGFDSPNVPLGSVNPSKLQDLQAQVESGTSATPTKETTKATKPETPAPLAKGQLTAGTIDLKNRPVVKNPDGTSSTVLTTTIEEEGKTILLPLIVGGKKVDLPAAIKHYHDTGEHMGIFKTEEDAEKYDQDLHNKMGWNGPPGSAQDQWQHGKPANAFEALKQSVKLGFDTETGVFLHPTQSVAEPLKEATAKLGQLGKGHGPAAEVGAGFAQGAADFGIDMTSLANVGITAGAMLLGGDEFKAATTGLKGAAKILKWAPQIAHGVFSAQMWDDLGKTVAGKEAQEAYEKKDYQLTGKLLARALADSFFIYKGSQARKAKGEPTLLGAAKDAAVDTVKGALGKKTAPPPETPKSEASKVSAEPAKPDFDSFRRKNFILKNGKLYQRGEENKGSPGYSEDQVRKHFETGEELPKPEAPKAAKEESSKTTEPTDGLTVTRGRGEKATEHPLKFHSKIDELAYRISKGEATPEQVEEAKKLSGRTKKELARLGDNEIRVKQIAAKLPSLKPGDSLTVKKTITTAEELEAKNKSDKEATAAANKKTEAPKKAAPKAAKPADFKGSNLNATEQAIAKVVHAQKVTDPKARREMVDALAGKKDLSRESANRISAELAKKARAATATKTAEPPKAPVKAAPKEAAKPAAVPDNVRAAQERMKARLAKLKSERGSISNKPVSEEDRAMLNDLYTIGKHYVTTGAKDFGKWSKQMVDDFGDSIKEHLKPVWDKIQERSGNVRKIQPATSDKGLTSDAGFQKLSPAAKSILRAAENSNKELVERYKKANPAAHKEAMEYLRSARETAPSTKTKEPPKRETKPNAEPAEPNEAFDPKQSRQPIPDRTPRMHRELSKRVPDIDAFYKKTLDSDLFKQQPKNVQAMHRRMAQLAGDEKTFDTTLLTRKDPIRNAYRKYLDKAIAKQPKPLSKIQADSLKVLAQADPDRAVNALISRKGYTRDEAETLIRPYTDKQITKTAEPPAAPKEEAKPGLPKANNEGLDHTTALKAAEVVQGRFAKATSDLRHYPLEFKVLDAEGKELHTQTVKDPREMDSIRPTLAASILEPGAASIEYKAGGSKGTIPVATAIKESASIKEIKPKAAKTAAPPTRESAEPDDPFGPAGAMAGEEEPKPEPEKSGKKVKAEDLALPNKGTIVQEIGSGGKYRYLGISDEPETKGMLKIRPVTGGEAEYVLPSEWDQFRDTSNINEQRLNFKNPEDVKTGGFIGG